MTFKQKTTQEKQTPFDISACMAMMEKMMGEHMAGCDCAEMMSQITGQAEVPDEWLKVMSQMLDDVYSFGVHQLTGETQTVINLLRMPSTITIPITKLCDDTSPNSFVYWKQAI